MATGIQRSGCCPASERRKPEPDGFSRFRALTLAKSYAWNFDGDKQGDAVKATVRLGD